MYIKYLFYLLLFNIVEIDINKDDSNNVDNKASFLTWRVLLQHNKNVVNMRRLNSLIYKNISKMWKNSQKSDFDLSDYRKNWIN